MLRLAVAALAALSFSAPAAAQAPCPSRLFVSGYFSTVHVFDACTGAFIRNLDVREHLNGAMAVPTVPDLLPGLATVTPPEVVHVGSADWAGTETAFHAAFVLL